MRQQTIELQNGHIYTTPTIPLDHLILNYGREPKDQYWRRPKVPENYKDLTVPERNKIIDKFWSIYFEGLWFWNNGTAIYMPPKAGIFYSVWSGEFDELQFYGSDKFSEPNHPQFRWEQLKSYYFSHLAEQDLNCIGTFDFKQRRDGKTLMKTCDMVYDAIQAEKSWFGIISKTYEDARDICWYKLMTGFKGLPKFFKPTQSGSSDPKTKLIFDKPARRLTLKNIVDDDDEEYLGTTLTYRSTKTNSFDGAKLKRLLLDEFCKFPSDVSPAQCLSTHLRCVKQGRLRKGMIDIITSPVEYKCRAFDETVQLWHNSDYEKRDELNTTKSGLWRWFSSSEKCLEGFIDIYGNCDENAAREYILNERKKCSTPQELRSLTLQQPLYIEEIIDAANLETIFLSSEEMKQRRIYIMSHEFKDEEKKDKKHVYLNLEWENGIQDSQVVEVFSKNQQSHSYSGRWCFAFAPDKLEVNRFQKITSGGMIIKKPFKDTPFVAGLDPINKRLVQNLAKASIPASYVYKYADFFATGKKDFFFSQYYFRPNTKEFFEDMIKQCVYFGSYLQFEAQNANVADWFEDRGYWDFLLNEDLKKRNERKGNAATPRLTQEMISLLDAYFTPPLYEGETNHLNNFWFDDLLEDALPFDPEDTEKFHLTMAAGQTLLGVQKLRYRLKRREPSDDGNLLRGIFDYLSPIQNPPSNVMVN